MLRSGRRRGVFRGAENLGMQARALKFRSALLLVQSALLNLGARSQKLGAHSERIQSGGAWRRTPGAPTGLERDLKSSERTPSGYRADTDQIQSGYRVPKEGWCGGNCPTLVRRVKGQRLCIKWNSLRMKSVGNWVFSARKRLCCTLLSNLCTTTQSKGVTSGALPRSLGIQKHLSIIQAWSGALRTS